MKTKLNERMYRDRVYRMVDPQWDNPVLASQGERLVVRHNEVEGPHFEIVPQGVIDASSHAIGVFTGEVKRGGEREGWRAAHGSAYAVPEWVMAGGEAIDTSWRNDAMPSFAPRHQSSPGPLRLWVDHPDFAKRETGGKRFAITWDEETLMEWEDPNDPRAAAWLKVCFAWDEADREVGAKTRRSVVEALNKWRHFEAFVKTARRVPFAKLTDSEKEGAGIYEEDEGEVIAVWFYQHFDGSRYSLFMLAPERAVKAGGCFWTQLERSEFASFDRRTIELVLWAWTGTWM